MNNYMIKLDDAEEIDTFQDIYLLPILNLEDSGYLNRQIYNCDMALDSTFYIQTSQVIFSLQFCEIQVNS